MRYALLILIAALCACRPADEPTPQPETADAEPETVETEEPEPMTTGQAGEQRGGETGATPRNERLARVLSNQPETVKARYDARRPQQTLDFFGVEPGMTVVEALPGGGWYTRILVSYLGSDGELIAANYPLEMWPNFGFADEAFMERIRQWPETFPARAAEWCQSDCAPVSTVWLGDLPAQYENTADVVLFVRALHNLARFQNAGIDDYLDQSLADAYAVLEPGGVFGVVQHEAREDMPDEWADGSAGYLKKSFVVERAEAAGFELVDESAVNANPNDRPDTDEVVWRLPPSLRVPEDAENRETLLARYESIGESHRMTLKFRKPDA
jgi:predicted methyltransferase